MAVDFVYHHWMDPPPKPQPESRITIPLTSQASMIPLVFGRCRVTAPILAYTSIPITTEVDAGFIYQLDMLFVLGIGFYGGGNHVLAVWQGDRLMRTFGDGGFFLKNQTGNGDKEDLGVHLAFETPISGITSSQGNLEFLNGNPAQQLVDPVTGSPTTWAGQYMTAGVGMDVAVGDGSFDVRQVPALQVPGYRGYMSAFLWADEETDHWAVGLDPQVSSYSFEVSSYSPTFFSPNGSDDCNPIEILYDLLTSPFGKLALDASYIDMPSFVAAAQILTNEFHFMSIAFQDKARALDMISSVLRQIDGGMFENPVTGKLQVKLARADYDPATVLQVNPANCVELQNFAAGGWTDITNRVVVTFTDRANAYKQGTAVAYSQANAVGQDGEVREITLDYPGITSQGLADAVASRELQARSKPTMKCRAIVNRSFLRTLPLDVVKLTWPDANIAGIYFRVVGVSRGTLENPQIALDLVQDSFYVHRNVVHPPITGGGGGTFGTSL
jgi:hypothetical protein